MERHQLGYRFAAGAFVAVCGLLFTGCPQSKPPPPPPPPADTRPADVEHRVSYSGETLALIAAWYTGKGSNWTIIREANPGLRPERINLGQTIVVPGGIVIERRPLPKKFVQDSLAKFSPRPVKSDPVVPSDDTESIPSPDPYSGIVEETKEPVKTAPPPSDEVNLEDILKEQIEAQKKASEPVPTPAPAKVSEPVKEAVPAPLDTTAPPAKEKAPAAPGDSEREQLLDELLTQ